MPRRTLFALVPMLAGLAWAAAGASADDEWPQFRGPDGQGHATAKNLPTEWSETENITWKTPIPGLGHSSPLVGRGLIWLTTALDEGRSLRVVAVDAQTGRIVIEREVLHTDAPPPLNAKNSLASPTGVLEGDRVYVHFGTSGTALVSTADGAPMWTNQDLKIDHTEGPGSSPIIWQNLLIVHCDGSDLQYIVALDKETGKIVWRTDRTGDKAADGKENKAFCTPLVIEVDGKPLLISPAARHVFAYDPADRPGAMGGGLRAGLFERAAAAVWSWTAVYLHRVHEARAVGDPARWRRKRDRQPRGMEGDAKRAGQSLAAVDRRRDLYDERRRHRHLSRRARPAASTGASAWGTTNRLRRCSPTARFIFGAKGAKRP